MDFTLLFFLAIGGSIFAYVKLRSGEMLRFETTATERQVVMSAVGAIGTKRKWTTLAQGEGSASFTYQKGPNALVAIALLVFFIIPGIVYLVLAGRREALNLATERHGDATVVQITSNGWRGKSAGRAVQGQLGSAVGRTLLAA